MAWVLSWWREVSGQPLTKFWKHMLSGCQVCDWGIQYHLWSTLWGLVAVWLLWFSGRAGGSTQWCPGFNSWQLLALIFTFLYFPLTTSIISYLFPAWGKMLWASCYASSLVNNWSVRADAEAILSNCQVGEHHPSPPAILTRVLIRPADTLPGTTSRDEGARQCDLPGGDTAHRTGGTESLWCHDDVFCKGGSH